MTTLDPALDRLRSKELSFGCVVCEEPDDLAKQGLPTLGKYGATWRYCCKNTNEKHAIDVIYGHPLTRGRICHLYDELAEKYKKKVDVREGEEIAIIFIGIESLLSKEKLYDQTEIERQQHEKRPELRELLIKFAEYI